MTSRERVLNAIRFKPVDYIPVNAKKEAMAPSVVGRKLNRDYFLDGPGAAEAEIALMEIVDDDFCVTTSSVSVALGTDVEWPENDYPQRKAGVIKTMEDVEAMGEFDPWKNEFTAASLETARILKQKLGDEKVIETVVSGVFNTASGLAGIEHFMQSLITDKPFVKALCDKVVDGMIAYAKAFKEVGGDIFFSPDASSSPSCISPKLYAEQALPHHIRWAREVKKLGLISCYHPCGGEYPIIDMMKDIDTDILWFSDMVDLSVAQQIFYRRKAVAGDVSGPDVLFLGNPSSIDEYIKNKCASLKHKSGAMIHPGCGLSPNIPIENLKAMVDATRKYSELAGAE